jgi:glycosyltransferase involved in cell wall biosynthesis
MNISIALATHNGRPHLEKQIQSLLQQTCMPKEIIISDDGSTDGTCELLEKYCRNSKIIKVVHSERQGINKNFQNAVSICSGEYVAFCDQDDIWAKDKLALLYSQFSEKTLLAYGKSSLIGSDDQLLPGAVEEYVGFRNYRAGHLPFYFYFSNCISGHAMMVRKDLIERALPFPTDCMYDQWLALIASAKSDIIHVPEAVTYHRIHDLNAINNREINREKKSRRRKLSKYQKYSNHRTKHLTLLQKGLAESETLSPSEYEYLSRLFYQIKGAKDRFFDIRLFFLLIQKRRQLFHGNLLRECRNRALGGRYYKLLDFFNFRKAH